MSQFHSQICCWFGMFYIHLNLGLDWHVLILILIGCIRSSQPELCTFWLDYSLKWVSSMCRELNFVRIWNSFILVIWNQLSNELLMLYPTHERSSGISETSITSSAIESGTEHVVGQPVKRKEKRTLPALFRRDQRQLDLLQCIRYRINIDIIHNLKLKLTKNINENNELRNTRPVS